MGLPSVGLCFGVCVWVSPFLSPIICQLLSVLPWSSEATPQAWGCLFGKATLCGTVVQRKMASVCC